MPRPQRWAMVGLWGLWLATVGCERPRQQTGRPVDIPQGLHVVFKPMTDLLGLPDPIVVAITRDFIPNFSLVPDLSSLDRFIGPLEPAPWLPLRMAMGKGLNAPVRFVRSNYRSIRYHLGTGRMEFAWVSATEYAEITRRDVSKLVAIPVNTAGTQERSGLIIVKKDSKVQSLKDVKGKRFEFGPRKDAILHWAALEALKKEGLTEKDIVKQALPPFGHHINSYEVAKAVLLEGAEAGVVDELEFRSWPEKKTLLTPLSVCQDQFRVIAETDPVPEGPIIASKKIDPALFSKMQDLLIHKLKGDKSVLGKLHYQAFVEPDPTLYQPLIEKLQIEPEPATTQPDDLEEEADPDEPHGPVAETS